MLRPLIRAKYHIAEKIYYIIYGLFPAYYRKKSFKHSANGTQTQVQIWTQSIIGNKSKELRQSSVWGNPELAKHDQYDVIKSMVTELINENSVVLELGAYDGYWTQFWLGAKNIICVDVMMEGFDLIKERCPVDKITFYQTEGNELRGIDSNSVDIIFSIHSLMRIDRNDLEKYFLEFKRILKPGGKAIVHLPSISKRGCQMLGFTYLTPSHIKNIADGNFMDFRMHNNLLSTGVILEGTR
jgi:SAM-dependent methyltransferase